MTGGILVCGDICGVILVGLLIQMGLFWIITQRYMCVCVCREVQLAVATGLSSPSYTASVYTQRTHSQYTQQHTQPEYTKGVQRRGSDGLLCVADDGGRSPS